MFMFIIILFHVISLRQFILKSNSMLTAMLILDPTPMDRSTARTITEKHHKQSYIQKKNGWSSNWFLKTIFFYAVFFILIFFNKRIDSIFNPDDALPGGICFSCLFHLFPSFLRKKKKLDSS